MLTNLLTPALLAAGLLGFWSLMAVATVVQAAEPMVAHNVYFSLNDNSAAAKQKLVAACKKYLSNHPGEVSFSVGTRATDLNRPVNDRDFDVSLRVLFQTKAFQDAYQKAQRHLDFIQENQGNWKKVRVFDSYLAQ